MSKTLCKLVSDGFLDDHTKKYTQLVNRPKYVCMKCGRVANDEDSLCRPKKMKDKKEDKQPEGVAKMVDDMATEKMADKIDRKIVGKSGKKNPEVSTETEMPRRVKVSKYAIRHKSYQEKSISDENLESPEDSFEDDAHFEENLPNED